MAKILLADDDAQAAQSVAECLEVDNHSVDQVYNGKDALERMRAGSYQLVILDWAMPELEGVEVLRAYRAGGGTLPVLMLTGKTLVPQKMEGLDSGADDYLTKPFHLRELLARVRSLLRRPSELIPNTMEVGGLLYDPSSGKAYRAGVDVNLLAKEAAVLEFLLRNRGRVYSVDELLDHVWHSDSESSPDAVRQCITRMRKKIDVDGQESIILTMTGYGYKIRD